MYILCIVLIIIASILLILAVLAQSPKSGMAANFGASNQVMGVRQTANFLEKASWYLAIGIVVLCILSTVAMPSQQGSGDKALDNLLNEATATPAMPDQVEVPTLTPDAEAPVTPEAAE
jgi:preprotein translocase subunit SecG